MFKNALEAVEKYNLIESGDKIITALSGGADSTALLFFLSEIKEIYNLSIFAVHVNHMIRGEEAERDERFVRQLCERKGIQILIYYKNVPKISKERKLSIEEGGRIARYQAFNDARESLDADKIAVAHNKNDQAETFIMRLARGSGAKGLSAISPKVGFIIRPLINATREQIEIYCDKNEIPYVTDSTNKSNIYTRNKIRNQLLPWLKENLNPDIVGAIADAADILREQNEYMEEVSSQAFKKCIQKASEDEIQISILSIKENHVCVQKLIIIKSIEKICKGLKNIGLVHINEALCLIDKGTGKKILLPYGIICETQYNNLIIRKNLEKSKTFCYELIENIPVYIAEKGFYVSLSVNKQLNLDNYKILCTKMFKCDKMFLNVNFRTRLPGDRIKLRGGSKKLKDYFIDKKLPISKRDEACIVAVEQNVLSVLDIVDSEIIKNGEIKFYIQLWENREAIN